MQEEELYLIRDTYKDALKSLVGFRASGVAKLKYAGLTLVIYVDPSIDINIFSSQVKAILPANTPVFYDVAPRIGVA